MKMETPKIDVVRFQEADVIVASPAPVFAHKNADLYKWGDTTQGNAGIYYHNDDGSDGDDKNLATLQKDLSNGYLNATSTFTNNNNTTVTLADLLAGGDAEDLYKDMNGTYESSNNGLTWTWLRQ